MIKRTSELKALTKLYEDSHNQMVLLSGTNRSLKEQIIRRFLSDKRYFYYRARNASPEGQLALMMQAVEEQYGVRLAKNSYDECFTRVKSGDSTRLVVVIDEFQLIAKKDPSFFEAMVKLKNRKLYPGPVLIILCNSSLVWERKDMEKNLGEHVKAIDGRIGLDELSFLDIVRTFPEYSVAESVRTYGILGGVPEYLDIWDGSKSVRDNCVNLILDERGPLYGEAERYIGSELRELAVYDTILSSMARGNEKLNDLFQDTGYSRAKISVYLKNLASFDVVEKIVSFETGGWDNTKKGIYRIKYNFINFWFRFIYPNLSASILYEPEQFYDSFIGPKLDEYLRRYFVGVCREYLQLMNMVGKVPIHIERMGTWIGKTGTIDIVGQDAIRENVVGICNWDDEELTYDQYESLLANMKRARIRAKTIYLFSAKSFDERLRALEQEDSSVVLVDMTEL